MVIIVIWLKRGEFIFPASSALCILFSAVDSYLNVNGLSFARIIYAGVGGLLLGLVPYIFVKVFTQNVKKERDQLLLFKRKVPFDFRFKFMYSIFALILIMTIFFGKTQIPLTENEERTLYLSFYSSWVEDVVFFIFVGAGAFFFSLRRPTDEQFNERVSNLFSGHSGSIIEYNKKEVTKLAGYAESCEKSIEFIHYDKDLKAYYTRIRIDYLMKNMLHDEEYSDVANLKLTTDKITDDKGRPQIVTKVTFGKDKHVWRNSKTIHPIDGFSMPVPLRLDKDGSQHYIVEYKIWMKVGETCSTTPNRFTKDFQLSLENSDIKHIPKVRFVDKGYKFCTDKSIEITSDEFPEFHRLRNIGSKEKIFVFELDEPTNI